MADVSVGSNSEVGAPNREVCFPPQQQTSLLGTVGAGLPACGAVGPMPASLVGPIARQSCAKLRRSIDGVRRYASWRQTQSDIEMVIQRIDDRVLAVTHFGL